MSENALTKRKYARSSKLGRWWSAAEQHPRLLLAACLLLLLMVCAAVLVTGKFEDPRPQFLLGAMEIVRHGHISWDFLPIGYAAFLGWCFRLGSPWGLSGMQDVAMWAEVVVLLLIFICFRAWLRPATTATFASVAGLFVSMHPELLQALKKVKDGNLTLLALLLILLAIRGLRERPSFRHATLAGAALAFGIVVRPNLALLPLLLVWALLPVRRSWRLAATSLASLAVIYCLVTTVVHGWPFFPQNGLYNLYAGTNPHTRAALLTDRNGEASIVPDMRAHGLVVGDDWSLPADRPGVPDARDRVYHDYYRDAVLRFVRSHPGETLALFGWKLLDFVRPETNRYHYSQFWQSQRAAAWLMYRTLTALVAPLWLLLLFWSGWRKRRLADSLVVLTAVFYTLPFVLTNADPDLRAVLDVLLLADILRMLYQRFAPPPPAIAAA